MKFKKELKKYSILINQELKKYLEERKNDFEYEKVGKALLEINEDFIMRGGKRIRPINVIIGYLISGKPLDNNIVRASLCTELLHAYFLIHDDIMDMAPIRRDKITVHKFFENYYKEQKGKQSFEHFGNSMGILSGDILGAYSFEVLLNSNFPADKKLDALKHLTYTNKQTCFGQLMDIAFPEVYDEFTEEMYMKIIDQKTASYTFETPLKIGMSLGGVSGDVFDKISKYGYLVGKAFQIQDDLIDIYGEGTGKQPCKDIMVGKRTLVVTQALKKGSEEDVAFLESKIEKEDLSEDDIKRIREIIEKTGSKEYSLQLSKKLLEDARKILGEVDLPDEVSKFLSGLLSYLDDRRY